MSAPCASGALGGWATYAVCQLSRKGEDKHGTSLDLGWADALFCVCDGHNGRRAAELVTRSLARCVSEELDRLCGSGDAGQGGSAAPHVVGRGGDEGEPGWPPQARASALSPSAGAAGAGAPRPRPNPDRGAASPCRWAGARQRLIRAPGVACGRRAKAALSRRAPCRFAAGPSSSPAARDAQSRGRPALTRPLPPPSAAPSLTPRWRPPSTASTPPSAPPCPTAPPWARCC